MAPLSPELAERLAGLAGRFHRRLVASAVGRLVTYGVPYDRAQDVGEELVQEVWADVARKQRNEGRVLGPEPVDEETARRHLYGEVKHAVFHHLTAPQRVEEAADFGEPQWRGLTAGPMDASQGPLTDRCRELLEGLSPRMREAMVERCYGVPEARLAELLGVGTSAAHNLVCRAVARLRGQTPVDRHARRKAEDAVREPVAPEELSAGQREALERMPQDVQIALLLRLAGVSFPVIAKRTGYSVNTVSRWAAQYACVLDPAAVPDGDGLPEGWLRLASGLSERHRQAVIERSGGASWPQIAELLGCSKSNARSLYASGARALWAAHRNRQAAQAGTEGAV
ncbi:helix-turn-helix domain-containing protein [Streptomyces violaceusniger]|uniref:helix-turn-helix domain-containing protein n=1 Tax=Streptomyces violaceusniger TaxID=68280 RepID=UPI0034198BC6